jgi:hypothetical protein
MAAVIAAIITDSRFGAGHKMLALCTRKRDVGCATNARRTRRMQVTVNVQWT